MNYRYFLKKKGFLLIVFVELLNSFRSFGQTIYQPYDFQYFQKFSSKLYSSAGALHTSIKPYLITDSSTLRPLYDSLMNVNGSGAGKSWLHRILINQHLIDVANKEYTFYFDYITDLQIGREFSDGKTTGLNTRGYQLGGTIGSKFFFYSNLFENQGTFANYENAYINNIGMIPGQSNDRTQIGQTGVKNSRDWSYTSALIGFQPSKSIALALGVDKTFIGDGYRSVLLSDYASNYPLLRITANLGSKIQYMAMWAYLDDPNAVRFDKNTSGPNDRRKWAVFHYIDWNINNRASIGFFNALIAAEADDLGNRHGFDANYINPIFFASSIGPSGNLPDHTLFGFNAKYKILKTNIVYGQALIDQANGSSANPRNAFQLGFRGFDLFKLTKLNYLFEFNTATPYTYANTNPIVSYSQFNEPLAHPFGANFKEWLAILNYSLQKFDFQGQLLYSKYGLDSGTSNNGKNIGLPDNSLITTNANTGQGLATSLKYAEGTVSYLINPKFNFRFEVGALIRQETNNLTDTKTVLLTFGMRSSFRNLYHDF